jgi:hypothetical protein
MDALLGSLAEAELMLVRETDPDRLAGLDEDALIDLHTRIRRARNKHVKVYRRKAARRVAKAGGRGKARPVNSRDRGKAEVFENALSAVSGQLAVVAKASAGALEAERLELERLELERLEAERLEGERLEAERLEAERLERERSAAGPSHGRRPAKKAAGPSHGRRPAKKTATSAQANRVANPSQPTKAAKPAKANSVAKPAKATKTAEPANAKKAAKSASTKKAAADPPPVAQLSAQRIDRRPDSPDLRKRRASTRATGARRQARRDSR